ncbi:MAG TPA: NYN domain-containing protein [Thermoleophilaceae bacterium]|nr:NYN domain-containing protein [Thermoleophilaceae bacterium]
MRPLTEQRNLITGSTDGLGRRVAAELAGRGAQVIVHGRDPGKVEEAAHEVGAAEGLVADLADLAQVRRLADAAGQLDTLVNNAGVIEPERRESADGYELTLAVNHLSHFLLTELLLPRLREPARIVNVSSIGQAPLDWDDLMFERGYDGYTAYARSKLAQVLFTIELAERLAGRDVTVNALHPATLMDTKMVLENLGRPRSSVEEGVEAVLRLVGDPGLDGVSGRFFDGTRESAAHAQAYDAAARRRLGEESERLTRAATHTPPCALGRAERFGPRWLVDGMNVIGSRPTGWWRDRPRAMRELVEELKRLDAPVTVVFDGRPIELGDTGEVEVVFASRRGRNAADDDVAALAAASEERLRVVTSDGELAERVRRSGAEVVGAGAFRARLDEL